MADPLIKDDEHYTYGMYLSWPENERWELIDGVAYNMSPAPNRPHQKLSGKLFNLIYNFIAQHPGPCEVYIAPFDVVLAEYPGQERKDCPNVVQPDILVVCDPVKLENAGCFGAPDWVIELLSPYTSKKDMNEKYRLYEKHGVREYWVIDPAGGYLHIYSLGEDGRFGKPRIFVVPQKSAASKDDGPPLTAETVALPGLIVDLTKLFDAV